MVSARLVKCPGTVIVGGSDRSGGEHVEEERGGEGRKRLKGER